MAFQGSQQPDMIGLALNLMQMRRQNEMDDQRLALEKAKMEQDARAQAIAEHRDNILFGLEAQRQGLEVDRARREMGLNKTSDLAGPLDVVLDPNATQQEQSLSAQDYLPKLMARAQELDPSGGADLGRYLNQAGIEAGGMVAQGLAGARKESAVKEADAARQDKYDAKSDARAEGYRIAGERREEQRAIEAEKRRSEAERIAQENGGLFDDKAVKELAKANRAENSSAYENERKWESFDKLRPDSRADTLKAINLVQREIDPSQVTDGNIRMWAAAGVDNGAKFLARLEAYATGTVAIPPELGPVMIAQLKEQLSQKSREIIRRYDAQQAYMDQNGFSKAQRRMATTDTDVIGRLRKRAAPAVLTDEQAKSEGLE